MARAHGPVPDMKFFKKKQPEQPIGRRRPVTEERRPPGAFSYYSQRSQSLERTRRRIPLEEPENQRRHNWSQYAVMARQRFGLIIVAIVAVICLINLLRLNTNVSVESLNETGSGYLLHSKSTYEVAATRLLASSVLNNNKLTVNTAAFERHMKQEFPELTSVEMALPLAGHRPHVYIRIAEPAFILVGSNSQSFIIDETGTALQSAVSVPNLDSLQLPVIKDESGLVLRQGHTVLSGSSVAFISIVTAQLEANNVGISRLVLPSAASQLDVYVTGKSYYVKFNLHSDSPSQAVGAYLAASRQLEKEGSSPKEYFDTRIDGRVYYK